MPVYATILRMLVSSIRMVNLAMILRMTISDEETYSTYVLIYVSKMFEKIHFVVHRYLRKLEDDKQHHPLPCLPSSLLLCVIIIHWSFLSNNLLSAEGLVVVTMMIKIMITTTY